MIHHCGRDERVAYNETEKHRPCKRYSSRKAVEEHYSECSLGMLHIGGCYFSFKCRIELAKHSTLH